MGLLDKLWDDTLAGPRPEKGLGRLRKPNPLFSNYGKGGFWTSEDEMADSGISKDIGYDSQENALRVTRSIMIKRPSGCPSPLSGTPPPSPAESASPLSAASGGKEWNPFRRNSNSDASNGALGKNNSSPYQV
ncbi:dormancy-associated protein homolog 3 isoform X1 [Dendrobium catenatum]|uniref:Auxin-repressed 12.5 kDa protein n=1 Tax=Dendrobium catenatum TaxID=906689 RepID=A0A2I0WNE0_9ASPA|nr:dormancy-associated protein homolog 3 isoform X1 [Dendrobium catenatum]PKU77151.1 Auxin-repressed 12.5 kDa protein [Dendrobium catenatum]